MDPQQVQALLQQLDQMLTSAGGALTSTNADAFNQMVRQFNLNYTNAVAGEYGYNAGVGQPASPYAPTLAAQQDTGGIGYIPNVTGYTDQPSLAAQGQYSNQAMQAAGLTGYYGAPASPPAPVGSWVQADGGAQYGMQYGQVLPSGQIQRVGLAQAVQMGFKPGQTPTTTMDLGRFVELGDAPPGPTSVTQTMAGQQNQSQLVTNATNQALAQANATGMYQAPHLAPPPGMAYDGTMFSQQPQSVQQTYLNSDRGDVNAAMAHWVTDVNNAMTQAAAAAGAPPPTYQGVYGPQGAATETMQAEQQYFNQANQLGTEYGQYYSPLAPGQQGQAGVNTPRPGQITEQGREFNVNTASDLAKLASSLTGPADYFKYLQALNGGRNILQNLYTGGGQTAGGAVGNTGGAQSLDNILAQFGLNSSQLTGGVLPYGQAGGGQGQTAPGTGFDPTSLPGYQPWMAQTQNQGMVGQSANTGAYFGGNTAPSAYAGGQVGGTPSGSLRQYASNMAPTTTSNTGGAFFGGNTAPSAYAGGQVGGTPSGSLRQPAPAASGTDTRLNTGGAPSTFSTFGTGYTPQTGGPTTGDFARNGGFGQGGYGGGTAPTSAAGSSAPTASGSGGNTPTITSNYQLPPPNQIQPTAYYNLSPSGQQFIQGAYAAAGYNPQDINWFVSQETPATSSSTPGAVSGGGTAGSSTRFANPAGQSLFA